MHNSIKFSVLIYMLLSLVLVFVSCDRDEFENKEIIDTEVIPTAEEKWLAGTVTSFSDVPIDAAEISLILDGKVLDQVETDLDGVFEFESIENLDEKKVIIKVKKEGFSDLTKLALPSNSLLFKLPSEGCELSGPEANSFFDSENYMNVELVSINGRVFTEDGSPAAHTRVWVNSSGIFGDGAVEEKTFIVVAVVNPDGTWETIAPIGTSIEITLNPYSGCADRNTIEYGVVGEEDITIADITDAEVITASRIKVKPVKCSSAEDVEWQEYFHGERQASVIGELSWHKGGYYFADDLEIELNGALDYCNAICDERLTYYTLLLKDNRTRRYHYEYIELGEDPNIDFGDIEICTEYIGETNLEVNGTQLEFRLPRIQVSPVTKRFFMNSWFAKEGTTIDEYNQLSSYGFSGQDFESNKVYTYTEDDKTGGNFYIQDGNPRDYERVLWEMYVGELHIGELDDDGYVTCHIDGELLSVDSDLNIIPESRGMNKIKGSFKVPVFFT